MMPRHMSVYWRNTTTNRAAHYDFPFSPMIEFPCVFRSPQFTNRKANQENQSVLCFHLCRKLEQSRMPSSRERYSCLAMGRENRDKWHSLWGSVHHVWLVTSVLIVSLNCLFIQTQIEQIHCAVCFGQYQREQVDFTTNAECTLWQKYYCKALVRSRDI